MKGYNNKTCVIMQPTYLPWLGYFDLIRQSDIFVFLNDVQFSKQSWQVKNRIKNLSEELMITIPVKKSSLSTKIDMVLIDNTKNWKKKHLKSIYLAYKKSEFFDEIYPIIENVINTEVDFLSEFNTIIPKKISSLLFGNRDFIDSILKSLNIEFTFVFLDDDFYYFMDSEFPQFLNINDSIEILKKFLNPKTNVELSKKIYVTREDSNYRKILNEGDVVTILRERGYKVINPQLYEIDEQIEIFSNAEKIIAPHGSNLANIIFCKPGTEIFEITPSFKDNEKSLEDRYLNLSLINNLKYNKIVSDTVNVENHSNLAKKYIHKNVLSQSNYYKNLIVKIQELSNII